jgi:hypothetical protein
MKQLFISLTLLLFTSTTLLAQNPAFTYQGRLTESGAPVNGVYDLTFTLYDAANNGSTVGTSNVVNDLSVTNGVFTVALDFGAGAFDGNDRWLQIAVRPGASNGAYANLTPRQPITSTPYATHAANFSGPVSDSQLSVNVARVNSDQTFTGNLTALGTLTAQQLTVGNGHVNPAVGSSIAGGVSNYIFNSAGFIGGGENNRIYSLFGFIGGGQNNRAMSDYGVIGGGADNLADSMYAAVGGGDGNSAIGPRSFVGGGQNNLATGDRSTVGGGLFNRAVGLYATVPGGRFNVATNDAFAAGKSAEALHDGSFVWADSSSFSAFSSRSNNQFLIRAAGGVGIGTNNPVSALHVHGTITATNFSGPIAASQLTGTISSNNIGAGSITSVMLANGAVGSDQLASGAVTAVKVATVSNWFALTIPNPTPDFGDVFSDSVAALGTDRVVIGAPFDDTGAIDAGAAYLFSTSGTLLTTFTNPTPGVNDQFGYSVAAVGTDWVLIGAYRGDAVVTNGGAAYLFSTNGTLITTFIKPGPWNAVDGFGVSVAALGSDRVIVGADRDDNYGDDYGNAYLFSTNGSPLAVFINYWGGGISRFGAAAVAVGTDRVLIGAYGTFGNMGAAHLYATNGTYLMTFTNPAPAGGRFGVSLAAVGTDRMLIGSSQDDTGAVNAGAAFLFSTNGTLLTTFTNPTPSANGEFGISVAALGNDRVLIGADNTGGTTAGAVYLFSTNGALLATFTNPTPSASGEFGISVAAVGSDRFLIGGDDTGASSGGAAFLFSTETYTPGLIADGVNAGSITTASLGDGVVNPAKLDPSIGIWMRSGDNVYRAVGNVGIGKNNPATALDVNGTVTATVFVGGGAGLTGINAANLTGTISSNNIGAGSITSTMLAAGAVGSNQLATGAVTTTALASGAVTTTALAAGAVTADKVATATDWFPLTIANPTPGDGDIFGNAVAGLGSDRVIIGASYDNTSATDAGAAYLFSISGALLTTFANPVPAVGEEFGKSVAALGSDRVIIGADRDSTGADRAGVAYLFRTNGTLLATFNNPTPAIADFFGQTVAALGSDRVLINAYLDDTGANDAGVAYLFNTNGALLTTFNNPTPGIQDFFGYSLAALGSDRVLIGARNDDAGAVNAGVAYLFNTNGALLTTFFNPTPASQEDFGRAVAAVGTDRVLIGAPGESTGAPQVGVAYLFSTNGTLLTTFTNPTPASFDSFGGSLTALGSDRVLITASFDDTSATDAGATYLFSTNGTLLATFTTPSLAENGGIIQVAAMGSDGVLVGAPNEPLGAYGVGAVYVFSRQTFATGLVTEAVAPRSITTASLEDGAVTLSKLHPSVLTWSRSDNNVYRDVGKVGIGTSTPDAPLEVVGNWDGDHGALEITGDRPTIRLNGGPSTGNNSWLMHVGNDGPGNFGIFHRASPGNYPNRLTITPAGNVGIGTLNPSSRLEVAGTVSFGASFGPKLNLFNTDWGFGIQNGVMYSRAGAFAWFSGGSHNDNTYNPGAGGVVRMILNSGGLTVNGTFVSASDRDGKENFRPVDARAVLDKVAALPLSEWNYKADAATRHVGPMAQDFYAAFGVGPDNKHIATVDADGVALAAIQGLNAKLEEKLQQKETEIAELKQRLDKLEKFITEKSNFAAK